MDLKDLLTPTSKYPTCPYACLILGLRLRSIRMIGPKITSLSPSHQLHHPMNAPYLAARGPCWTFSSGDNCLCGNLHDARVLMVQKQAPKVLSYILCLRSLAGSHDIQSVKSHLLWSGFPNSTLACLLILLFKLSIERSYRLLIKTLRLSVSADISSHQHNSYRHT